MVRLLRKPSSVLLGLLAGTLLAGGCLAADSPDPIVAEVMKRDAELSAAHGRGDMAIYRQGLSQRYVYIDVGGRRVTADTLASRRANDQLRLVSSESSESEALRLADTVAWIRASSHTSAASLDKEVAAGPRYGSAKTTINGDCSPKQPRRSQAMEVYPSRMYRNPPLRCERFKADGD